MSGVKERLDDIEKRVMSKLKDFQCATVERIAKLYESGTRRVLVSDEVGLGKTLIARGTIVKLAQIRKKEKDDLVKIVYVCSNGAIAEQNLNKLKIADELKMGSISTARLSMQHLNIFLQENSEEVKNGYIQLIPLTPDTSFRLTRRRTGAASERALMFAILRRLPQFGCYEDELEEILRAGVSQAEWDWHRKGGDSVRKWRRWRGYEGEVERCEEVSKCKYLEYMLGGLERELSQKQDNGVTYFEEIADVCDKISREEECKEESRDVVGKLRLIFAKLSIEKLDPDLVIMDEFQRFKFLLDSDPKSETGMLASKVFDDKKTRMLLLSATPYKMYSTLDEIEEEEDPNVYYKEFLDVMDFLRNYNKDECAEFQNIWSNYSVQLKEYACGVNAVLEAKNKAEDAMYSHMCRTERMAATADIIDDSIDGVDVSAADITSYIQMSKLLDGITKYSVPSDYIKSCPYLLSFMRDYKLKRDIEAYFKTHKNEVGKLLKRETFFVEKKTLAEYEKIPCNNARLESVMNRLLAQGAALLLWVPPSKGYYAPTYPFSDAQNFTKTLVFSSWEMVPRMLASLVSYEVERKTIGALSKREKRFDVRYFANDSEDGSEDNNKKRYPLSKLNFAAKDGEPQRMPILCLIYPSRFLAECYDPIDCFNNRLSLAAITRKVKDKITKELSRFEVTEGGGVGWYYIAPILLDGWEYCLDFCDRMIAVSSGDEKGRGFIAHLKKLRDICLAVKNGTVKLGKRPDDLIDVLADMAIASPAVCAYRTYKKSFDAFDPVYPAQFAMALLDRINKPEATAVIELCASRNEGGFKHKSDDAFWQSVLTYCKAGNFQAMFDEYMHLIANGTNGNGATEAEIANESILQSMVIKTTPYEVDTFKSFVATVNGEKKNTKKVRFRSHFAVAFTKGDGGDADTDRKKTLRNAFNSPFRPFVLASTSIGQEGLDFHNYCRRIVHWNLPANPIDLEQREGRINRYECLAIRQNIAKRYGDIEFHNDVWQEMLAAALRAEWSEKTSGLVPYWGLTQTPDMVKIERIVPMYPFSRDEPAYERLIKILSLYRLTLGQARQEELLEYIMQNRKDCADLQEWFINLSPYYKKR